MNKNLTSTQLLLFGLAGVVLLIAAFSLILLQDPSAPLPFAPPPATSTFTPPPPTETALPTLTDTTIPTRQTSYTPFAFTYTPSSVTPSSATPGTATPPSSPPVPTASPANTTYTPNPSTTGSAGGTPTRSATPTSTRSVTPASTNSGVSPTPTLTSTLSLGEIGVTGRIILNGTPVANVVVSFEDDIPPRNSATNQGGHYSFTTMAPGIPFILTFDQTDNPQLTPASQITSLAWVKGTLPKNVNPIDLPDFEISLNVNDTLFEQQSPTDGAAYSASAIGPSNEIQFLWTFYGLGGSYRIDLGPNGSDIPIWTSDQIAATYFFWDGTLNNGSHITEGTYWWRVGVTKSLGNYVEVIFTQPWDIFFNP